MPIQLAITVAGAVSLGSYEAGVLFEIVDAIAQHNRAAPDEDKIFIDVLTGASAGGMSVTVLAQKLLFEAAALSGPYDNVLYRAWVRDIDFQPLLHLEKGEDPTHSILSSDLVERLSANYLTARYGTLPLPAPAQHPAVDKFIRLGLALSNLNGIDYSRRVRLGGSFTYTRFEDEYRAIVDSSSDSRAFWEPLRNAAVSCGAFPFAFRVKDLVRQKKQYPSPEVVFLEPSQTFTYTDGGVFQNEPLGLAKNLVDDIDPAHLGAESRFYLLVSPHAKKSIANSDFSSRNANFEVTAVRLLGAIYGQAQFQDWIVADHMNEQIELFNTRAIELSNVLAKGAVALDVLQKAASALLPLLFAGRAPGEETLESARQRLTKQFHSEYDALAASTNKVVADAWIDSILVLETAAGLGPRDEMNIYGITAEEDELAGAGLYAFVGFFEQEYRDHDYDVGRTKAQAFLQTPSALFGPQGRLPALLGYSPKPIRAIDHSLDGLSLGNVPRDQRTELKDRLANRADDVLREAKACKLLRFAAEKIVIDPHIATLLKL